MDKEVEYIIGDPIIYKELCQLTLSGDLHDTSTSSAPLDIISRCEIINWCSHYGKERGGPSKKLKTGQPYHPAILHLGIYPEETKIST